MSIVHVVPIGDLVEHDVPGGIPADAITKAGSDAWLTIASPGDEVACSCNPTVECCPSDDGGPDGWLWIHHSLDGRENRE